MPQTVHAPLPVHPNSRLGRLGVHASNQPQWAFSALDCPREATDSPWLLTRDGDPVLVALYHAHYSSHASGGQLRLVLGPGEKLAAILPGGLGGIGFRYGYFRGEKLVYLAFFSNHSAHRSSDLVRAACALAWRRWPGQEIVTLVDPFAVRSSNPGYCFQCAGFVKTGRTQGGLVELRRLPDGVGATDLGLRD